jgi:aminotransferase
MGRFSPSARAAHLDRPNPLRALTQVIDAVPGGINLGQGVCDLDTPRPLVEGACGSIQGEDRQTYTPYAGLPELREQIARRVVAHTGLDVTPDQVCVTLGASGAFFAALQALLDPGDEVILFEPFYGYHWSTLRLCGLTPVPVRLQNDADLSLDLDAVRAALTKRTKAVLLNTPSNPSGKVFTRDELVGLGNVLDGTDVTVLTDEVYEYMVFDGREHISPKTIPELFDRTLSMSSFSKTFSVTGWRVGYIHGPAETVDRIGRVCDQMHVCAPRPMQRGIQRALAELGQDYYAGLSTDYQRRRDMMVPALRDAGFEPTNPQGAYYVLADYRGVFGDVDPMTAVRTMIDRIGINAVPGHVFYSEQDSVRQMRFHFAVEGEVLDDVCRRLRSLKG